MKKRTALLCMAALIAVFAVGCSDQTDPSAQDGSSPPAVDVLSRPGSAPMDKVAKDKLSPARNNGPHQRTPPKNRVTHLPYSLRYQMLAILRHDQLVYK